MRFWVGLGVLFIGILGLGITVVRFVLNYADPFADQLGNSAIFEQSWLFTGELTCAGIVVMGNLSWLWAMLGFVAFYVASAPVKRMLRHIGQR